MKHHGTPHHNNNMMMTMSEATSDLTSDRFRKATLSPPQSIKGGADNMSAKGSNNGS